MAFGAQRRGTGCPERGPGRGQGGIGGLGDTLLHVHRAGLLCVLGVAALGCSPVTQYRYSAFVPAARPMAWDGRVAPGGSLRFEGSATNTNVIENVTPQLHDTAVLVPSLTLDGSVTLAVDSKVELGVRGVYASYDSAQDSAVGTMPVPHAPPSTGLGPEVRIAIPVADKGRFKIGVGLQALSMTVPYSAWQLGCAQGSTCVVPRGTVAGTGAAYSLMHTDSETHWTTTLAILPSYSVGEEGQYGHVFGGLTATTGFSNDGFTDTYSSGSTVSTFWPLLIASVGYGYAFDIFRISASVFRPLTSAGSPVDYSLGGFLTLGVAPRLWEGKR